MASAGETVEQVVQEETFQETVQETVQETAQKKPPTMADQVRALLSAEIENQNVALNVLIGFLGVAQRRGVFAIDESAKIFECIKSFRGENK
jgi:hypothetical protein